MRQPKGNATLFWNKELDVYFLQSQAADGLAIRDYGAPLQIPAASFEAHIASLVIKALDSFSRNVWSRGTARQFTSKEYRDFRRKHVSVSVEQLPTGQIIVRPLHREANGYVALSGEAVAISGNEVEEALPAAIREAFGKAT